MFRIGIRLPLRPSANIPHINCRSYLQKGYKIRRSDTNRHTTDPQLIKGIEDAIKNQTIEKRKLPLLLRIGAILVPTALLIGGVVAFNAYHGEETYIPLLFQKRVQVNEENSFGIDLVKLQKLTMNRLITKLSINHKFQNLVGLPITSHTMDRFDVFLQYKTLMSSGVNIDLSNKPHLSWTSRQYSINHEKLSEFLEPMGISDSDFQFQVLNDPASSIRDYKIVVEGRLKVNGNELFKTTGKDCDVNFRGVIDFDHSQNIRFEDVRLCFKDLNGTVKVESLF